MGPTLLKPKLTIGQEPKCWIAPHGCTYCRDREGGRDFRRGMLLRVLVPNDDPDFECPYGVPWGGGIKDAPDGLAARAEDDGERFRALWGEFHRWTLSFAGNEMAGRQWLAGLLQRLPCGRCRSHAVTYLANHPPDLTEPSMLFPWGVEWHNEVNRRLGKQEISVEDAITIHRAD